jgi:carboxypeptidase Q
MRNLSISLVLLISLAACNPAKTDDRTVVREIYSRALSDSAAMKNLQYLCTHFPGRIGGSDEAAHAVKWVTGLLKQMDLDTVYLEPLMVKKWDRGEKEIATVNSEKEGKHDLTVCAIGWSVGTGKDGISAPVVEVRSREQLKELGEAGIRGKIVFFNQTMDPTHYYTFDSYGESAWQRVYGASEAARYGATGVIVRSLTMARDNFPHTGIMHYKDSIPQIPAFAVSTLCADSLSDWLKQDPHLHLFMRSTSKEHAEVQSYNVIGEIWGSEKPEEIIAFGGHLDAWDITQGAQDDGAGVAQSIEVMRLFRELGIRPKHTLRVVVFMDEEVAQRGAKAYAEGVKARNEKHLAAIETDRGGFTPYGFSIDASVYTVARIKNWQEMLQPYGIWFFEQGGSGVDIRDLKPMGIPLLALVTDSQRYFDVQHSPSDTYSRVNQRELQLGSATIASMVYLLDNHSIQ